MAKKDFTKKIGSKNLSSLIPTEAPEVKEREKPKSESTPKKTPQKMAPEKKEKKIVAKAKTKGKNESSTVTTFRISNEHLSTIKALAYWNRKKIQEVMNDALEAYLKAMPDSTLKKAKSEYEKQR